MHDYGKVMAIRARVGDCVSGATTRTVVFVDVCRNCGKRSDSDGFIDGVAMFRRTPCVPANRHNRKV